MEIGSFFHAGVDHYGFSSMKQLNCNLSLTVIYTWLILSFV